VPGFPSLGRLDDVLIFNDNWGTYRGTAWRITVESWLAQPVWRKLLGVGPGMMHTAVADWAGAGITDRMKTFYAAHNEYLELLLTAGAAGLAAWLWFVIAHLRRAAQNWLRPGVAPVTLALVSYLPMRSFRIRVSMIFPEIMLLFALLQVFCLPEKGDAAAEKAPAKHGKKAKPDVPADHHGLARQWLPPILAAVVMMAVCGAASRVYFLVFVLNGFEVGKCRSLGEKGGVFFVWRGPEGSFVRLYSTGPAHFPYRPAGRVRSTPAPTYLRHRLLPT